MMPFVADAVLAVGRSPAASMVVKVTVTTVLALAGARLARRSRAAVRHVLLAAAFAVLVLMPIGSVLAPAVRVEVPTVAGSIAEPPARATFTDAAPAAAPVNAVVGVMAPPPRSAPRSTSALLLAGWGVGAALFLLPVVVGLWQLRALHRAGQPWPHGRSVVRQLALDANINRRVDVLLHESIAGPMTCGAVRPTIVLPVDAQAWNGDDLRRAIVHELEHVRRGDWLSQGLARAVCACYWFHPLVWIAWRRLALEAERACDDAVLRRAEATAYADQLVALAQRLSIARRRPVLAMANRDDLAARVVAVLDSRQARGRAGAFAVTLACVAAALLVATMSPLRIVAGAQSRFAKATGDGSASATVPSPVIETQPSTPSEHARSAVDARSARSVSPNTSASRPMHARDALVAAQTVAQATAPARRQFEVASVKPCESRSFPLGNRGGGPGPAGNRGGSPGGASPGRLTLNCQGLMGLIRAAYLLHGAPGAFAESVLSTPIEGGPDWVRSERYTIDAKADDGSSSTALMQGPMMQALLEDRFKLKIHRQTREIPIWALTLAKGGPKLARFQEGSCIPVAITSLPTPQPLAPGETRCEVVAGLSGPNMVINAQGVTIDEFSRVFLNIVAGRPIIDKTGLTGRFTIDLEYAPPPVDPARTGLAALQAAAGEPTAAEIFTAIQEQLGLKLEPAKGPGEFLVIDHVERPSEN
jgi:uncharacterized protein (TIGR03435 family)